MNDIGPFGLHRSRIPMAPFKPIVSQFLSPLSASHFSNLPGSTIEGRIITKGMVEYYFKTIGFIAVLFIELRLKIANGKERLDAGFRVPVYGIQCDGDVFEFFLFNGTTKPFSFKHGLGPNDPPTCRRPFRLLDPADTLTTRPFIDALCPICKIIFDLLLSGYVSSLKAYHNHSVNKSTREGQPRKSVEQWEEAMSAAVRVSQDFRDAETKRQTQLTDEADSIVEEAMASLKRSVDAIPILHKPELIMPVGGWDMRGLKKYESSCM
ncbi:hypothetical protein V8E52_006415 [Russula decolorans]